MTIEEKRAEFIKACEMQGVEYAEFSGVLVPVVPVKMRSTNIDAEYDVVVFAPIEYCFVAKSNALSQLLAPKPAPARVPWDASDFDRVQPRFLRMIENKDSRHCVLGYGKERLVLSHEGVKEHSVSYEVLSTQFTLIDGTELYTDKEAF